MRLPVVAILLFIVANVLCDLSIVKQLKKQCYKWLTSAYCTLSAIIYIVLAVIVVLAKSSVGESVFDWMMWGLFSLCSVCFVKFLYVVFRLISLLPKLFNKRPWRHCPLVGAFLGIIVFIAMWWGALVTPRQLDIENVNLSFDKLPKGFDGYRILQVSDLHVGTYGHSTAIVDNIVQTINEQNVDLVVFTGDVVNRKTDEIQPFISSLKQIKAKDGVISILGNHDYGDYYKWPSEAAKKANMDKLIQIQRDSLNWNLLMNEHIAIRQGNDSIMIIGVENWGEPPFPTYGDLSKSYPDVNDGKFKLLLSHNPKHWDEIVSKHTNIDLTLSGHTHAMQMMFNLFGFKFSPSSTRYPHWGGLYEEDGKKLYVNIGTGEVGIPMRIGATPELTVFTLKCK